MDPANRPKILNNKIFLSLHTAVLPAGHGRKHGASQGGPLLALQNVHLQIQDIGHNLPPERAPGPSPADLCPGEFNPQGLRHLKERKRTMDPANRPKILNNKIFLYLTEFFAGMSVMAVELGATQVPHHLAALLKAAHSVFCQGGRHRPQQKKRKHKDHHSFQGFYWRWGLCILSVPGPGRGFFRALCVFWSAAGQGAGTALRSSTIRGAAMA